jgi:Tol biopolymer transport system component
MSIKTFTSITSIVLSVFWCPTIAASQTDTGIIAYISSSVDNKEIHRINPDGTQDQVLWSTPSETPRGYRIGTLSWHPDGTEVAFDSGHNWQRSMAIRDLFSISLDGVRLRQITAPPGSEGSANLPTGKVKFWVRASEQGDVQVYTEGAKEPYNYFAKLSKDYQITMEVADWGEGVRQQIRLLDPNPAALTGSCRFSQEGLVDIIPGQEVDLEDVPFNTGLAGCPQYHTPSWSQDGNHLLYLKDSSIRKVNSHGKAGDVGVTVHSSSDISRAVFAKTAALSDEALFFSSGSPFNRIYQMTVGSETPPTEIKGAIANDRSYTGNKVIDIAWLPDGSGFITSQKEAVKWEDGTGYFGTLYHYSFADKTLSLITRLRGERIGKLSVSPDGTSVVFERAQEFRIGVPCPCSLWVMNIDGSGIHQLTADGRAPSWGKTSSESNVVNSPIDKFYNWAEKEYPQYFSPHQTSQEILGYYARHYPAKNIYLGSKGGRVYVHGEPFGGLLDAGDLQGWLQKSGQ